MTNDSEQIEENKEEETDEQYSQLIPLKGKGDIRSDEIRAMSHKKSLNRSIGTRIGILKLLSVEKLEKAGLELLNKEISEKTFAKLMSECINLELTPKLKLALIDKYAKFHSTIHGTADGDNNSLLLIDEKILLWREGVLKNEELRKEIEQLKIKLIKAGIKD